MANRRMFSKTITSSSRFLMMSQSAQNLYFHFGMNADDDGFCEHFGIMRMTDSKPDDLKVLQAKGFVKVFDDRVLVITEWKENNYIQKDRYTPSKYLALYKEELKLLSQENNECIQDVSTTDTQVRLGKVRLGKGESTELRSDAPFSLEEEIKKLEDSSRRDLNVIALLLEERKPDIKSQDQFNVLLRRHLRAAKSLVPFTDEQIMKAVTYAKKEYKELWQLDTLVKILTK